MGKVSTAGNSSLLLNSFLSLLLAENGGYSTPTVQKHGSWSEEHSHKGQDTPRDREDACTMREQIYSQSLLPLKQPSTLVTKLTTSGTKRLDKEIYCSGKQGRHVSSPPTNVNH